MFLLRSPPLIPTPIGGGLLLLSKAVKAICNTVEVAAWEGGAAFGIVQGGKRHLQLQASFSMVGGSDLQTVHVREAELMN